MKVVTKLTLFLFLFVLSQFHGKAQTIITIAGNGGAFNSGDGGLASSADVYIPVGGIFDSEGNFYIALGSGHIIRRIATDGIISTVAGTGSAGYSGDGGLAISAQLNQPTSLAN